MADGILFIRQELERVAPDYQTIADCLYGDRALKGEIWNGVTWHLSNATFPAIARLNRVKYLDRATYYLPMPQADDESTENLARYEAYVRRAVFYNATRRTLNGYIGQLFQRPPHIEIPSNLEVFAKDVSGSRVDIVQLAKDCTQYVLPYGRSGLLADYPVTIGGTTRAQKLTPTVRIYEPWNITNWRTRWHGAQRVLELVVLREQFMIVGEDGFTLEEDYRYRVLYLDEQDRYNVQVWEQEKNTGKYIPLEPIRPTKADGASFNKIPFFFIGSSNNDPAIDHPPFLDISTLNVAHYRNSADYEEACYICGQPTLWAAGLTEEWYNNVIKGQIQLGARAVLPLPEGGQAGMLQPEPNTMPYEAMKHKETQLVTLGARISETPDVMRTATEATLTAVETSSPVLSTAANIGSALTDALKVCAEFVGEPVDDISFSLTTEATLQLLSPDEMRQQVEAWQKGVITDGEIRENFARAGIVGSSTLEEAKAAMERFRSMNVEQQTKETGNA